MRTCTTCGVSKPLEDFHRCKAVQNGTQAKCKQCRSVQASAYYAQHKDEYKRKRDENRDKLREQRKESRQRRQQKIKEYGKLYYNRLKADPVRWAAHLESSRVQCTKRRALKYGSGGSHTVEEWAQLRLKYHNKCLRCGRFAKVVKDHIVPLAKGGTDDINNLQPLCRSCNGWKYTKTIDYRY